MRWMAGWFSTPRSGRRCGVLIRAAPIPPRLIPARSGAAVSTISPSGVPGRLLGEFSERASLARWDRIFRERRTDQGWDRLRQAVVRTLEPRETEGPLALLDRVWGAWPTASATGREWAAGLTSTWSALGFPGDLDETEARLWGRLLAVGPGTGTGFRVRKPWGRRNSRSGSPSAPARCCCPGRESRKRGFRSWVSWRCEA